MKNSGIFVGLSVGLFVGIDVGILLGSLDGVDDKHSFLTVTDSNTKLEKDGILLCEK